ncbi:MAG: hypothetical protein IKC35_01635 [Clostridia bacterium]|nr:hypothetical protein [Clostridia bacterium]
MNILTYLKNLLNGSNSSNKNNVDSGVSSTMDKLKELQDYVSSQYDTVLPGKTTLETEVPTYERYEYTPPTDEEITQRAKDEFSPYVDQNKAAIVSEYDNKAKELNANKESRKQLYEDSTQKLKQAYDEAAETLSNDSLKRGLARSSIALNNQAAANKAYTQGIDNLLSQYNAKIDEIDKELNSLDGKLASALNAFNISSAAKLTERINELKSEREENIQKAIEYNNSLLKTEYEQGVDKAKTESDLYSDALSQTQKENELKGALSSEEKSQIEKNVYEKVVEILDSMPFDEARELFLNEPIFRNSLSDYYYYTLYYKYR